jgi:hypothetical protein
MEEAKSVIPLKQWTNILHISETLPACYYSTNCHNPEHHYMDRLMKSEARVLSRALGPRQLHNLHSLLHTVSVINKEI